MERVGGHKGCDCAMRQLLKLHPHSSCSAVVQVQVEAIRTHAYGLSVRYAATGSIADLCLPTADRASRGDGLWQHTCFEAFVRACASSAYYEFNFAPSTQWAAYRFDGYRTGMSIVRGFAAPQLAVRRDAERLELHVSLILDRLADLPADACWRMGLSAVVEETSGSKSYWSLAHPLANPDFHHPDCFVLELPPASLS